MSYKGNFSDLEKIEESNRIEGILRAVTSDELEAFQIFMALEHPTIHDLCRFVDICQPGAELRNRPGMNVRVGRYEPPPGGYDIITKLYVLLEDAYNAKIDAWTAHVEYEKLHPFTDCNGRSGRMLWYWIMGRDDAQAALGFLHAFYYQTLEKQS